MSTGLTIYIRPKLLLDQAAYLKRAGIELLDGGEGCTRIDTQSSREHAKTLRRIANAIEGGPIAAGKRHTDLRDAWNTWVANGYTGDLDRDLSEAGFPAGQAHAVADQVADWTEDLREEEEDPGHAVALGFEVGLILADVWKTGRGA